MMDGRIASYYTDGSSALKLDDWHVTKKGASIIAFPDQAHSGMPSGKGRAVGDLVSSIKARARDLRDASEMYCSLRFEDFHGCPYHVFTQRGVAILSTAIAALAIISLAFGA